MTQAQTEESNMVSHLEIVGAETLNLIAVDPDKRAVGIIKELVLKHFDLTWDQINVRCRDTELVQARHIIIYFAKNKTGLTLKKIGNLFNGGKDHATVIHAIKAVRDLMDTNKYYKLQIQALEKVIDFNIDN